MPLVYVIAHEHDLPFVEKQLIRPLPALGYDRWVTSAMLQTHAAASTTAAAAMDRSAVILAVVSKSLLASPSCRDEIELALTCRTSVVAVYLGPSDDDETNPALHALRKIGGVAAPENGDEPREFWHALAELLQPSEAVTSSRQPDDVGQRIEWNEEVFTSLLQGAVSRHDYNQSQALVSAFRQHVDNRPYPYQPHHANADLAALRKKRQFPLMRQYASAALESGTVDFKVRRQYAQALIELKEYEQAAIVLRDLIDDATAEKHGERFEARGLLGRLYKQRYVDSRNGRNGTLLARAIETYRAVFLEDNDRTWHGINAASCILRARRDELAAPPLEEAHAIARTIVHALERRQASAEANKNRMDVWDYATRVEAFVDLEAFDQASQSLDEYLVHPDMDAFEVSSTYRQFDEVLQLAEDERGRPLLARLAAAAERLRSGGVSHAAADGTKPMLVRVSDPKWDPQNIPDLIIRARLGTVLSISGSDETVKGLLKDPLVLGVEESRPGGQTECVRSLPFIRVAETYQGAGGPFSEAGGDALVAIIDDGIDVLHEAFLDAAGKSRIVAVWDQQDNSDPGSAPPGFDFGRFHSQADIAGYVKQKKVPDSLTRPNDGHGTHVASIAAGRKTAKFAGGVAPEAKLLIVISGGDEPTGYSHAHLAALTFIDQMATKLIKPVVVNVSQGMNAGAHDGKSALEIMFDEFAKGGRVPGRVVVKSAGNERSKRGHAKLTVPANGGDKLIWRCPKGVQNARLELWWHSANQYKFQLKSPAGDLSEWADDKHPEVEGYFKKRGPFTLKLVKLHPDNGDNLLKIDISNGVAATAPSDWTLGVHAVKVPAKADMHAWIERSGLPFTEFVNHDSEEMTLSIPGTSYSVITVGAIDADMPVLVGDFSSFGPTRDGREKPDICAPGVNVIAALRDSTDDVVAMDGTSMAAPHVTGAIALVLSKMERAGGPVPTATQIAAILRQKTRDYSAQWDRGQGYGVLDVGALLEAF